MYYNRESINSYILWKFALANLVLLQILLFLQDGLEPIRWGKEKSLTTSFYLKMFCLAFIIGGYFYSIKIMLRG